VRNEIGRHKMIGATVYKTESGMWAWKDGKGYGFTHESLKYILEYLRDTDALKVTIEADPSDIVDLLGDTK